MLLGTFCLISSFMNLSIEADIEKGKNACDYRPNVLIVSLKHPLQAMQTHITFVLVPTVLSSILPSSEYFQLRPAMHVKSVLADTPSLAKAVNL